MLDPGNTGGVRGSCDNPAPTLRRRRGLTYFAPCWGDQNFNGIPAPGVLRFNRPQRGHHKLGPGNTGGHFERESMSHSLAIINVHLVFSKAALTLDGAGHFI